jgi:flagellar motility protein MotE (MotC chaperone)
MNRVRLLPIVIVAASGLFVLKTADFVTSGQTLFSQAPARKITREEDLPQFARALARHRFIPPAAEEAEITGSVPAKKDDAKKDDSKKDDVKKAEADDKKPPMTVQAQAQAQARAAAQVQNTPPVQPLPQNASASERAILERLQERRGAIDDRAKELELRENMLKAAERKVDGRLGELKEVEDRISAGARAEKEEADKQMKTIVIMYETMKPKDAAKVFDRLNLAVLVPIVTAMNPRKMSEVLAVMTPDAAERLTVALANRSREGSQPAQASATAPQGELPRIDQAPAAAAPQRPQPAPPRR